MTRFDDWQERLHSYLLNVADEPFEWGRADCLSFMGGAVQAMTGVDIWSEHMGRYQSRIGMLKVLRKAGYYDLVDAAHERLTELGLRRVMVGEERLGDPVVIDAAPGQSYAITSTDGHIVRHMGGIALIKVEPLAAWSFE